MDDLRHLRDFAYLEAKKWTLRDAVDVTNAEDEKEDMMMPNRWMFGALAALALAGCPAEDANNANNTNNGDKKDMVSEDMSSDMTVKDTTPDVEEDMSQDTTKDMPKDDEGDMSSELTVENAVQEMKNVYVSYVCKIAYECPSIAPEFGFIAGRYADQATCDAEFDFFGSGGNFADLIKAVEDGRQSFDAAQARVCLDAAKSTTLDKACELGTRGSFGFDDLAECDTVFTGQVSDGAACVNSGDCNNAALTCQRPDDSCHGTCELAMNTCGASSCTEDQYCDVDQCKARVGEGEGCTSDDACTEGLSCNRASGGSGVCAALGSVMDGGLCDDSRWCAPGLTCKDNACSTPVTLTLLDKGEPCKVSGDRTSTCKPGTVCTNFTLGAQGLEGTCQDPRASGESCYLFFECAPGLHCEDANIGTQKSGTCVANKAVGEACKEGFDCASYNCVDDKCAGPQPACMIP